jgi:hypothetical protein
MKLGLECSQSVELIVSSIETVNRLGKRRELMEGERALPNQLWRMARDGVSTDVGIRCRYYFLAYVEANG